jgi:hypothetical protein
MREKNSLKEEIEMRFKDFEKLLKEKNYEGEVWEIVRDVRRDVYNILKDNGYNEYFNVSDYKGVIYIHYKNEGYRYGQAIEIQIKKSKKDVRRSFYRDYTIYGVKDIIVNPYQIGIDEFIDDFESFIKYKEDSEKELIEERKKQLNDIENRFRELGDVEKVFKLFKMYKDLSLTSKIEVYKNLFNTDDIPYSLIS